MKNFHTKIAELHGLLLGLRSEHCFIASGKKREFPLSKSYLTMQ